MFFFKLEESYGNFDLKLIFPCIANFLETKLTNGKEYVFIVRAINMVGLSTKTMSNGFIVDLTYPTAGTGVTVSSLGNLAKEHTISTR